MTAESIPVLCAVCNRRLRGYPTITGRYAVAKHRSPKAGRCPGRFFYARLIERREVTS